VVNKPSSRRPVIDLRRQFVPDLGDDITTRADAELNDAECRSSARTSCGDDVAGWLVASFNVGVGGEFFHGNRR
jgi:hypothetical protein